MGPAGGTGGTGFEFLWGPLWVLLVAALFVVGIYVLVRATGETESGDQGEDAVAVLERRYARGEIDDEEFEERRIRLTERPQN